jgi:DNA-binding response OmpR family regulator/HPt (histidine-containing phosphotransfer) domain-containing protein
MKILVVEDDVMTAQALSAVLTHQNYVVEVANDGISGWALIESYDYDLVLLDVMLPRLDGVSLCRQIRGKGLKTPILLLTGLDSGHDKALGLDAGADDYVVKPFEEQELVARVRALLRRGSSISNPIMEWRDLRLDPSIYEVTYGSQCLSLTPKEYGLLELFLRNSRRVFSCGMILDHLWAYEEMPGEEAVRTHIKGLRQKLKAVGAPNDFIETVYGLGYRLNSTRVPQSTQYSNIPDIQKMAASSLTPQDLKKQQASAMIQAVWHEFKDSVYEKVAVLARVKKQVLNRNFNDHLKQNARHNAHVLAGSLGTFGLQKGSAIARQLEQALLPEQALNFEQVQQFELLVQTLRLEIETSHAEGGEPSVEATIVEATILEQVERSQSQVVAVDDDPMILAALQSALTPWGITVIPLEDAHRTFEALAQYSPDLLILDVEMPSGSGIDLCRQIRKRPEWHDLPILFLTAHANVEVIHQVFEVGGDDFIGKPIAEPELVTRIIPRLERIRLAKRMLLQSEPAPTATLSLNIETPALKFKTLSPSNMTIESSLKRKIQQQSAIAQLGLSALKGTALKTLMPEIMASVLQSLEVEFCCLLKHLNNRQAFLVKDGMGWPEKITGTMLISDQNSQGLYTMTAGGPVMSEQLTTEKRFKVPPCLQDCGATSTLSLPIEVSAEAYGALAVYTRQRHVFVQDEIDFLEAIAQIIAGALKQQKTETALRELLQRSG